MKKFFLLTIFFLLFASNCYSNNYLLTKIIKIDEPWGSTFINNNEIIITEKSGKIKIVKESEIYKFLVYRNYELIWSGLFSHIFRMK